jgi:hypothetical protein
MVNYFCRENHGLEEYVLTWENVNDILLSKKADYITERTV